MTRLKLATLGILRKEQTAICLLVLVSLILHFATIARPTFLSFDEQYYVPAARNIIDGTNTTVRAEHPPLAQLLVTAGILLFGDNPLGWRFFSVIFGTLSIVLFYLICRQLGMPRGTSFLATLLLSIENMSFVLASVAMLDVYCLTFMLLSFWLYLKGKYVWAGLAVGLATLAKLSGALAPVVIALYWMLSRGTTKRAIFSTVAVSVASFVALLPLFDLAIWHRLINPFSMINGMVKATTGFTFAYYASSPFGSLPTRPWIWLIHLDGFATFIFNRVSSQWSVLYQLITSPFIWALIIPSMLFAAYQALKKEKASIFAVCWFAGTYLIWIPVTLISDRATYDYYFYPTIGAICIAISLGISKISNLHPQQLYLRHILKLITPAYLIVSLLFFMAMSLANIWLTLFLSIVLYTAARFYLQTTDTMTTSVVKV